MVYHHYFIIIIILVLGLVYVVLRHLKQYFRNTVVVSFIDGGNRRTGDNPRLVASH
jgi:hypothetical protein